MKQDEIDKELGVIPQPWRIMLELLTEENRYEFPEEIMLEKCTFPSYVDYCIRDSYNKGFHVISVKLGLRTSDNIMRTTRTLILKVGKLPKPKMELLC